MRRRLQQGSGQLVGLLATVVYLLTIDRSVSWWDCGEFLATSWTLGVGHPPGAPTYQLISHLVMLLSFGHTEWVAVLGNAVSALCGGITVGLLFATLRELGARPAGAWIGALCYLFCDTAWFSAVESEVYAMAMLFCSLEFYLALRFRHTGNSRLLALIGLSAGLAVGVHLMTLLVLPAAAWVAAHRLDLKTCLAVVLLFTLGLSTYAIIPLRAQANTTINEYGSSFHSYVARDQYEKAPLYPRMWRERDSSNWNEWNGGRTDLLGNIAYSATYQVGYMYLRYMMYNFIGRENLKSHRIVIFVLPLLMGLWGVWQHFRKRRRDAWAVLLMFLFGGLLLNVYLNHPCYEPRERDYAYILSFYAFSMWIGLGASDLTHRLVRWRWSLWLAPLLMVLGNWSDHDRSHCHSVHDIALNHLECCDPDAILITLGDNDTFPLWYLQQVEELRTDVSVLNVGLTGWRNIQDTLVDNGFRRPVYVTHYFYQRYAHLFEGRLRCEGYCWRLMPNVGADTTLRLHETVQWHITEGEYIDYISDQFLTIWQQNTGQTVMPQR